MTDAAFRMSERPVGNGGMRLLSHAVCLIMLQFSET